MSTEDQTIEQGLEIKDAILDEVRAAIETAIARADEIQDQATAYFLRHALRAAAARLS